MYGFKSPDIHEWVKENTQTYDLSDFKREDMNDNAHKKKLRCTKHALNGYVMSDMIGLNPKSCAFKYQHIEQKQEQGVSNAVVDTSITPYEYNNTLNTNESWVRDVVSITYCNQQLLTYQQHNIALTSLYGNMNMLDTINCEQYGYVKTENDDLDNISINAVEYIKQNTDLKIQEVKHIYM